MRLKLKEKLITNLIKLSGIYVIIFSISIIIFIALETGPFFLGGYDLKQFFTGKTWLPNSDPPIFSLPPLLIGSLLVTFLAAFLTIPFSLMLAIFINQLVPKKISGFFQTVIELFSGIPTVILGTVALFTLVPFLRSFFNLPTGLTALSASIMLALMGIPFMTSFTLEFFKATPISLIEASYALGANKWQTIKYVLLPFAKEGILAGSLLALGRIFGETMVVLMVSGNSPRMSFNPLEPIRVITATIGIELGYSTVGGIHYRALFSLGLVLILINLIINNISIRYTRGIK